MPASLKADLDRYAALHTQPYGEAIDVENLIPLMLEAFMARVGGFRRKGAEEFAIARSKLILLN